MKKINLKKVNLKNLKRETTMMLITVVCLTTTMISVSYGIFFDVKTNQNEQVITTGDLSVQISGGESISYLYPFSDDVVDSISTQSVYYLQNTGSTNASFTFTVTIGSDNEVALDFIKLAVMEYDSSSRTYSLVSDIITLSNCSQNEDGDYVLFTESMNSSGSGTYAVKVWLDENSDESIIGEAVELNVNVLSEVLESVMLYDFSGTLKNSSGNLSDATISLNNGSIVGVTNSSGSYTLSAVRSGTYSVSITLSDGSVIYDTLIVDEASSVSSLKTNDIYTVYGALSNDLSVNITVDESSITLVEAS